MNRQQTADIRIIDMRDLPDMKEIKRRRAKRMILAAACILPGANALITEIFGSGTTAISSIIAVAVIAAGLLTDIRYRKNTVCGTKERNIYLKGAKRNGRTGIKKDFA